MGINAPIGGTIKIGRIDRAPEIDAAIERILKKDQGEKMDVKTIDDAMRAVAEGTSLEKIPSELRVESVCWIAIDADSGNIKHVPPAMLKEYCTTWQWRLAKKRFYQGEK